LTDAIVGPSALLVALKTLPRTEVGKRMILSGPEPEQVKNAATDESLGRLLGKSGDRADRPASGRLRPHRRPAASTSSRAGRALPKDTAVRVVAVEQNRVVVAEDARDNPAFQDMNMHLPVARRRPELVHDRDRRHPDPGPRYFCCCSWRSS
jgi:hypothetical protein